MDYVPPYQLIDEGVEAVVNSREGMRTPNIAYTKHRIHQEMMGSIMGVVKELQLSADVVQEYFDLTLNHNFKPLPTDGKVHLVHHYVDPKLFDNPLYYPLETVLMKFKPASVQVGIAEFFFCWYDKDSTFGINNQLGYDISVSQLDLEIKGLNSNKTASTQKFDECMKTCSGIMVVNPYDNRNDMGKLKHANTRSSFCINVNDWRESFEFVGDSLRFINQNEELVRVSRKYKKEEYLKKLSRENAPSKFLTMYPPIPKNMMSWWNEV